MNDTTCLASLRTASRLLCIEVVTPSRDHELLVQMFRNRPQLAREVLHACTSIDVPDGPVEIGSNDLSQVVPTEYRADAVTVVKVRKRRNRNARGRKARGRKARGRKARVQTARAAIIVEVQLGTDRDKRFSWPLYVAALRAYHQCPVILLVLTVNRSMTNWARRTIEMGHPGFRLQPLVIELADLPPITSAEVATEAPSSLFCRRWRIVPSTLRRLRWRVFDRCPGKRMRYTSI